MQGGYIATCRHVWRDAIAAAAGTAEPEGSVVEIEYPHCWQGDTTLTTTASLADPCEAEPDGPRPDLVLLLPETIPDKVMQLAIAELDRFEIGDGYAIAGLPGRDEKNPSAVEEINVPGTIAETIRGDRRRQFSGGNEKGYWTDRGSSGSPVFLNHGQQLAGIVSLSETAAKRPGESPLHEGFVVPGTTINRYVRARVGIAKIAARANIPAAKLQPILEAIRAHDIPVADISEHLRRFVEEARARAAEPVQPSNEGADIDATIGAVRDKLQELDPAGARDLLQAKIAQEEQVRRQRLLPLLRERAAIERLAFDHEAAKATLAEITDLDPDAVWDWIGLGDLWITTGSLGAALDAYGMAASAAQRLGDDHDFGASHDRIGDVKASQGDLPGALAAYTASMAIAERLAARDPANSGWQRDLSVSHIKIGEVKVAQGDLLGALAAYTASMAIAERLAARDPANSGWQRDLSVSHIKIGDMKVSQGDLPGALAAYTASMAIAERLAARDPANSGWQRDLGVSHNMIGNVKVSQGDLPGALAAYSALMAIAERLAARDPANSEWQRDLSVSHIKIGDVKVSQGDLPGALAAYTASMAIRERLAARDPANSQWQRDLSVSHERIGDVKVAQDDLPGALAAYTASMAIRERLAARDPANSQWQGDLMEACVAVAGVAPDQARRLLAQALDIARDLARSGLLVPVNAWIPDDLEQRLAALPEDGTLSSRRCGGRIDAECRRRDRIEVGRCALCLEASGRCRQMLRDI
ncbi:MAG TPA: trypsin-like serine protease [Acetobacteraceae bacterium]|nr:trypsin-like serine protease [Acetobacteraceae bacterium]